MENNWEDRELSSYRDNAYLSYSCTFRRVEVLFQKAEDLKRRDYEIRLDGDVKIVGQLVETIPEYIINFPYEEIPIHFLEDYESVTISLENSADIDVVRRQVPVILKWFFDIMDSMEMSFTEIEKRDIFSFYAV